MQCDWEIEIASDAPVIDATWPGFIDLHRETSRAHELPEATSLPALAHALIRLNSVDSSVWTSKCDVWPIPSLDDIGIDRFDLDAGTDETSALVGCYIDLLPRSDQQWHLPARVEHAARTICTRLNPSPLICCRIDLIARQALITPNLNHFGITAYIVACGHNADAARTAMSAALLALADAVITAADQTEAESS